LPELAELPEIWRADPKNCSAGIDVAVITAPLALPFFGNLPAMFIDGSLTFYFNLVIACLRAWTIAL
jgi:hypothetical protein